MGALESELKLTLRGVSGNRLTSVPLQVQPLPWGTHLSASAAAVVDFRAQQLGPLVSCAPCSWRSAKDSHSRGRHKYPH